MLKTKPLLLTLFGLASACSVSCPEGTEDLGGTCLPVNSTLGADGATTLDASSPIDSAAADAAMADSQSLSNETCDGRDEDQDGTIDESLTRACGISTIGRCTMGTEHCENGAWVGCNAVLPQAAENCTAEGDENCNGQADEGCPCRDGQTQACGTDVGLCMPGTQTCRNQVWGSCTGGVLAATEVCNGTDEDCDGTSDNNVASVACGVETGECRAGMTRCSSGATTCEGAVGPAAEVCNGLDDDCDGSTDEGVLRTFYQDSDGDVYGNAAASIQGCTAPAGYVANATDCNDSCNTCYPGATEVCDNVDNNCLGGVDEGLRINVYRDGDGDTRGDSRSLMNVCPNEVPSGYVTNANDCDDNCNVCWTGASEVCDDRDNDCSGGVDNGLPLYSLYRDGDADGVGAGAALRTCRATVSGYVASSNDCDDGDSRVSPNQRSYYTTPRPNGSYDYDCNGTNQQQFPTAGGMCCTIIDGVVDPLESHTWSGSTAPACGQAANWITSCEIRQRSCPATSARRTQACR